MKTYRTRGLMAPLALLLVAGCVTSAPQPQPVYQHVPCSTPGAREEVSISLEKDPAGEKQPEAERSARCVKEVQ